MVRRSDRERRGTGRPARIAALVAAALLVPGSALALASDFEHPASSDTSQHFIAPPDPTDPQLTDKPNDPDYDQAEPGGSTPSSTNLYDEQFDLFGFPSSKSPLALYTQGANSGKPQVAGFNASGAWKRTRGRGDVAVAILDTGIRWDASELRDQIHLNTGELPLPQDSGGNSHSGAPLGGFDLNGNGVVDVDDFKNDPRVAHTGPSGQITGEDLINSFGHCQISDHQLVDCPAGGKFDNDGNGFANDIAGWNFFDDNNDPLDRSSYFAAHNHGTGRADDAAETGNDGQGSIGVCPHCQIIPIRVWDTFVSDGNTFALGMLYATDNGAKVIEGADGGLDHTAFAEQASEYAYQHGVVQTYSGDDLNTGNHNYPAAYGHAMLIQGTVPDTVGLGMSCSSGQPFCDFLTGQVPAFGSNVAPETFFRGANTTQFGGKSSISMEGPTGSINTGRASGGAGLVVSSALDAGITLRPDETREILEQTAEDVLPGNTAGVGTPDPAQVGWDSHFGWGRANLGAAVEAAAHSDRIPDEAAIDSPDWYAPLTGKALNVTGRVDARFSPAHKLNYTLEWGAGQAPTSWTPVTSTLNATGPITSLGSIDLDAVRTALAQPANTTPLDPAGPTFSTTSLNPFQHEFTVRLTVTDPANANRLQGVDRRVFTAFTDPSLRPGKPLRLGTGGEAQPRYADLNGDNVPELIVPTEDGTIHAYEKDGTELAGWPVHTATQVAAADHLGAPSVGSVAAVAPPREPPRGPAVADLDGDGRPEVITTAGIHVDVWEPDGSMRPGFPVASDPSFCGPALEHQTDKHPKCGFLASPALAHLEGKNAPPDIVVPSLDGHLYAWRPNGTLVPHFPVLLQDPNPPTGESAVLAESINEPAIVDLNGDGTDDVIAATNETYGASNSGDVSFAGLLGSQGQSTRVYAVNGKTGTFFTGWPIKISGLIESTLPLIGPGNDPAVLDMSGPKVVTSATSGQLASYNPNGTTAQLMHQEAYGPASNATDKSPALNLFESAAIGKLLPASPNPDVVKYEISATAAVDLLLVGQNQPYNHLIGAWNAGTGATEAAFPTITDDFQFLSSSEVAKIDPSSTANQVLAGNGLGLLHAYDGATGQDAPGFPKETGGWLFAPAALSDDGRIADITREGYLFEWTSSAPACQSEWPTFRHDLQNTGDYNADGTAPGAPSDVSLTPLGANKYHLTFKSPGDDGLCGTAKSYRLLVDGAPGPDIGAPVAGGQTVAKDITLPAGALDLTIQAVDDGLPGDGTATSVSDDANPGNVGEPADVVVIQAGGNGGNGGNGANGGKGGNGANGGKGGVANPCLGLTKVPRSSISSHRLSATRKRISLSGRAIEVDCASGKRVHGHVTRVQVSVVLQSHGRCRFLSSHGRLGHATSCFQAHFLSARVSKAVNGQQKTTWTFSRKVHLPKGHYAAIVRGTDSAGQREVIARSTNSAVFKLG